MRERFFEMLKSDIRIISQSFPQLLIPSGSNVYRKCIECTSRPRRGRTFFKVLLENISVIFHRLFQPKRKSLAPIVAQILEWEFAFLAAAAGKSDQRKLLE